jgi:hypothetical protein
MLPEWLWIIIVGVVLLGLMKIIFTEILTKSQHSTTCKESQKEIVKVVFTEALTKSQHEAICKDAQKEVKDMLIENREILVEHVKLLKEHLDLKLEKDILAELKKLNGKKDKVG